MTAIVHCPPGCGIPITVVAAWPLVSLLGTSELVRWIIRATAASATPGKG